MCFTPWQGQIVFSVTKIPQVDLFLQPYFGLNLTQRFSERKKREFYVFDVKTPIIHEKECLTGQLCPSQQLFSKEETGGRHSQFCQYLTCKKKGEKLRIVSINIPLT